MNRLALITCDVLPEPDPDQDLLLETLSARGIPADLLAWDNPRRPASDYELCIPRSCWNYYENPQAFLDWIAEAERSSRLINPPDVIRWNLHKRYLRDLEAAGIPIIPTAWFRRGEAPSLESVRRERAWDSVVVKPAVSAGSHLTRLFDGSRPEEAQEFAAALTRDRDVLVQPRMKAFEDPGERALVWIDGRLTHAVQKAPRYAGGVEQVSDSLHVTPRETEFVQKTLATVKGDLLYARVDVLPDGKGGLYLSELELIEPSLYLLQNPSALNRFVEGIERLLR